MNRLLKVSIALTLMAFAGIAVQDSANADDACRYYYLRQFKDGSDPHACISGRESSRMVADLVASGLHRPGANPVGPTIFPSYEDLRNQETLMCPGDAQHDWAWPSHLEWISKQ